MGQIVYTFEKNALEEVTAQITEYRGHQLIDIRVWLKEREGSDARPTRKDIALEVEQFPDLKKAVLELEKALKAENMLLEEDLELMLTFGQLLTN